MNLEICRLCSGQTQSLPGVSLGRRFLHCTQCDGVFVPASYFLGVEQEKQRYQQHRNDPTPEYESFLGRLANPLLGVLTQKCKGLDYGCGPVPVLGQILSKAGHEVESFDPFFSPVQLGKEAKYDFITCSEAAEHFHFPHREFEKFDLWLKSGGCLAVMTQLRESCDGFIDWYYVRDPTHVQFYSPKTMLWIAAKWHWTVEFFPQSVVIFRKAS